MGEFARNGVVARAVHPQRDEVGRPRSHEVGFVSAHSRRPIHVGPSASGVKAAPRQGVAIASVR